MAKRSASPAALSRPSDWNRGTLPRVVLIIGPESALREEALAALKKAAFGPQGASDGWVVLHGPQGQSEGDALTPATILDEVCTRSMFAADDELKVVLVRGADILVSAYYKLFEENLDAIPATAVLAFECVSFGKLKTTGFFKKLSALGAVVECNALIGDYGDSPALEQEVDKHARALGLNLTHGALRALLARSAKSLGVIEEELKKLALALRPAPAPSASPAGGAAPISAPVEVTEQDVAELCSSTGTGNAFDFASALLEGNARGALETLGLLFDRGIVDPKKPGKPVTQDGSIAMAVMGALTYKLTQLQDVRAAIDSGKSEFEALNEAGLRYKRADEARRTLRLHTSATLRRAVDALFMTFLDMRRGGGADPRALLEKLVFTTMRRS